MKTITKLSRECCLLISPEVRQRCFSNTDWRRIEAIAAIQYPPDGAVDAEFMAEAISTAQVLMTGWGTPPIPEALLASASRLQLLLHTAGSVKALLPPGACEKEGLQVVSAAPALAAGVAEYAFGLLLLASKGTFQFIQQRNRDTWWQREPALSWAHETYGATIGVIGASQVGTHLLRLCKGLDLEATLLFDPYSTEEQAAQHAAQLVDLDELMSRSDFVVVCAPATEETHHMINARSLSLMRDRTCLINVARGHCVDETALLKELTSGRLQAILDVTDPEPPVEDSPLWNLPNCVLTPHIAGGLSRNCLRQGKLIAEEFERFVSGTPLQHSVRLDALHRLA